MYSGRLLTLSDISGQKSSEGAFRWMATNAHCLLWYADIRETGEEGLDWCLLVADEQAARRFLPLDLAEGQSYSGAWYWRRVEEDRQRTNEYGTAQVRAHQVSSK